MDWKRLACLLMLLGSGTLHAQTLPLSFARDVMPAMTKAGCNTGACHGSFQGRGGMQLSLLGYDPLADYETLFLAGRGRRVNSGSPTESLLLRKASGAMPHGGGLRMRPDSEGYRLLREYIGQGLARPTTSDPVLTQITVAPAALKLTVGTLTSLSVSAHWSDGVVRDVTPWALFDSQNRQIVEIDHVGQVTAQKPGVSAVTARFSGQVAAVPVTIPYGSSVTVTNFTPVNRIDEFAAASWHELGITPANVASDGEYLRRVHLDLIGLLPTPDETRAFIADVSAEKRKAVVDKLLERPESVDLWSLRWSDLLRVHNRYLGEKGVASFRGWIRQSVRDNKPLDQWVRELIVSQGNLFTNGPVAFYFVDEKPEELAETTAQVFLGIRLQCTKCHHHPNEVWSQQDYYGLAAFFTRLEKKDTLDQGRFGGSRSLRPVMKEMSNRQLAMPAQPKVLGRDTPTEITFADDVRRDLADWITARDNPFFARNFANRYWAWLIGRGLVEPVDDMRATNPPSHPELLIYLERELIEHDFDPKHLVRLICQSSVYQRGSELTPTRDQEGTLLTHRVPRRLTAEVLLDVINQTCGTHEGFTGLPESVRATELPDPSVPSHFLTTFGRPLRNSSCDCARSSQPDLSQALLMLNSPTLHGKLIHAEGRLAKLLATGKSDDEITDELYFAAFARPPTEEERQTIRELLAAAPIKPEVWQDVLWTLINSAEFGYQH